MKITNNNLLELGFNEIIITPEEAGDDEGYTYYTFDIGDDKCLLISNAEDECGDGNYSIEFFNHEEGIVIKTLEDLTDLIRIIKSNIVT